MSEYTVVGICASFDDKYVGFVRADSVKEAIELARLEHDDKGDTDLQIAAVFEGFINPVDQPDDR